MYLGELLFAYKHFCCAALSAFLVRGRKLSPGMCVRELWRPVPGATVSGQQRWCPNAGALTFHSRIRANGGLVIFMR